MAEASNHCGLDAVSAACMPRLMLLPRIRSCQTKRWRAAAMLPQLQPHPSSTGPKPCQGKDPLRQDRGYSPSNQGARGNSLWPAAWAFSSLICGLLSVVTVRIPEQTVQSELGVVVVLIRTIGPYRLQRLHSGITSASMRTVARVCRYGRALCSSCSLSY